MCWPRGAVTFVAMATDVFISYRREHTQHAAGRLKDDLAEALAPPTVVFRDIEDIEPGLDFTVALERSLARAGVMLVLIDRQWLDVRRPDGGRRLDDPADWVRLEVATALKRDIRVVPVLLEGVPMPTAAQLPPDVQALAMRQAFELSDGRWRGDVQRLVEALVRMPGLSRRPTPAPPPAPTPGPVPAPPPGGMSTGKRIAWGLGLGVAALSVASGLFSGGDAVPAPASVLDPVPAPAPDPGPSPSPAPAPAPAPSPSPSPAPAPVAAPLPDVSGLWRTNTGEVYQFQQSGRQVRFIAEANGQVVGQGQGELDNGLMRLTFSMQFNGSFFSANCDMRPSPDARTWTGACMGPNGPFGAQIFR